MVTKRGRARRSNSDRKSAVGRKRARQPTRETQDEASRAYEDLLSEAAAASPEREEESRPLKRRRTAARNEDFEIEEKSSAKEDQIQTVLADSASSDASDVDWEQVDFNEEEDSNHRPSAADDAAAKDISIDLSRDRATPTKPSSSRRLAASKLEKKKLLQIHKIHLCCLLAHVFIRNSWCNDEKLQAVLKSILSSKTVSYLNPDPSLSQFQRSRSFVGGLEQACEAFRPAYKICTRGLKRPAWNATTTGTAERRAASNVEDSIDKDDFYRIAQDLEGSRDDGAQLFCALLRSASVDARLVCSLQVLPFSAPAPTQTIIESKPTIDLRQADAYDSTDEMSDSRSEPSKPKHSVDSSIADVKRVKRFGIGVSSPVSFGVPPPSAIKRRKIHESSSPVYWVEAFNSAIQKWLPVDPLVTKTVAKPQKLEPPVADSLNDMSYVIAFEDDGTAKDVTRRYAKAYNAKTRKSRVEATEGGESWWKKTMKAFDSGYEADRDQVEDAELAQKEASEPMPRNVQAFKDHPYYALERHLRRNQVIHPKKEVGKLSVSRVSDTTEPIYRSRDVHIVKSADKWYRAGRDIKPGEQPLKYSTTSRRQRRRLHSPSPVSDHEQDESNEFVGLYAEFQTVVYVPPPVVDGRIPKNVYGNLDVHGPSMIPPGGVHVRAGEAATAAKILGVDYADAVTGFKFKGRRGTAVMDGVVVAVQFAEAIEETVLALRWQDESAERGKKGRVAVALWKRFLVGLRIRQRVMRYGDGDGDGNGDDEEGGLSLAEQVDEAIMKDEETQREGGFLPDRNTSKEIAAVPAGNEPDPTVNWDRFTSGQSTLPVSTGPMCIPSPWDNQPPQSKNRTTAPETTHHSRQPISSQRTDEPHQPQDTAMADANVEESGGGFLIPTNDGFEAGNEDRDGGGFVVSTHKPTETSTHSSKPPTSERFAADPRVPVSEAPNRNSEENIDSEGLLLDEATGQDAVPASVTATRRAVDGREEVSPPAAGAKIDSGSYGLDVGAEEGAGLGVDGNDSARDSSVLDDDGSMMSHDPEDEDAEPEWLLKLS